MPEEHGLEAKHFREVIAPEFYASGVLTVTDGKDFQLIFTKRSTEVPPPDEPTFDPVVVLNISRGTAADIHASIGDVLSSWSNHLVRCKPPISRRRTQSRNRPRRPRDRRSWRIG